MSVTQNSETLLSLFPNCTAEELLDLLGRCGNDLDLTINTLLDGGYGLDLGMGSGHDSGTASGENSSENESEPTSPQKKEAAGGETTNEEIEEGRSSSRSGKSESSDSFFDDYYDCLEHDFELEDDNDGIEIKVPQLFVKTLVDKYGTEVGFDVNQLTIQDMTITTEATTAFDLFRYLYINLEKRERQERERAAIENEEIALGYDLDLNGAAAVGVTEQEEIWIRDMERILDDDEDFPSIMEQDDKIEDEVYEIKQNEELQKFFEMKGKQLTMAERIKFCQLRRVFPSLPPKTIEDVFLQSDLNLDQALENLKAVYPSKYQELKEQKELCPVSQKLSLSGDEMTYEPDVVAQMSAQEKRVLLESAASWRNKVDETREIYVNAMDKASQHKTQKAVYPLMMKQAGEYKRKMHNALNNYWFYTLMGLNAGNRNPNKIDLHGLSVYKAREVLVNFLQNRKSWVANHLPKNSSVHLNIITGQGRHSINNIPKLNPAVRQFLLDNHYSFTEGDSVGTFLVRIANANKTIKTKMPYRSKSNNMGGQNIPRTGIQQGKSTRRTRTK